MKMKIKVIVSAVIAILIGMPGIGGSAKKEGVSFDDYVDVNGYAGVSVRHRIGATLAIPSAIQADVIDYDELLTGERREGQYIGLWSIAKKLAAAVGIGVGLSLLGMAGYTPNVQQTEGVQWMLRVLYALIPSLCNLLGLLVALAYPIDDQIHHDIREAIAERRLGGTVIDPLTKARIDNQSRSNRGPTGLPGTPDTA